MRLFLSSYKLGNSPERLPELIGKPGSKGLIIGNAGDLYPEEEQQEKVDETKAVLKELGINSERLDLRNYFGKEKELKNILSQQDMVLVRGGNSFVLLRAMLASGFDSVIKELLSKDKIVYAGWSAGSIVMCKSLKGIDLVDDPVEVPEGYDKDAPYEGLGIINYSIAPHYRSNHPESHLIDKTVEFFESEHIPYKALTDGQVIIINNGEETIIG